MRTLILIAAAALSLAACQTPNPGGLGGIPASPSEVADKTVLDEKVGIAAETLYTAASRAAALAIRTGLVTDKETIKRIGALDQKAYGHLVEVRLAYTAANATDYASAFRSLNETVKAMLALTK